MKTLSGFLVFMLFLEAAVTYGNVSSLPPPGSQIVERKRFIVSTTETYGVETVISIACSTIGCQTSEFRVTIKLSPNLLVNAVLLFVAFSVFHLTNIEFIPK